MGKKLTYEFVKEYFSLNNCQLISTEYQNNNTKLNYICENNHESTITFNNFKKGGRCRICSINKQTYTYNFVKKYFKDNDCKLLETDYINSITKLNYICKNGHITSTIFSSFKNGHGCNICYGNKKHTYDFVKEYFKINGYKLLEEKYINALIKIQCLCPNNHKISISFNKFSFGKRCGMCSKTKKLTFDYVNQYFKNNNCILLDNEYINSNKKLNYICKNRHKTSTLFNDFKSGHRCLQCSGSEKLTFEYVSQFFKNNNYKLLESEYKNNMEKMEFICNNNHKSSITFNNFQRGVRCGKCKNKTEVLVLEHLELNYQNIIFQPSFDWCKKKFNLPFDLLLDDFNIIIECDGRQHFESVSNWGSPKLNLENDIYKANLAINNGYKIIRISQEDVFNNRFDWKDLLKESIEKLIKSEDNIIYLSNDANLYNKHKFELTKKILENKLKYKI
jgi:hypothetical protein